MRDRGATLKSIRIGMAALACLALASCSKPAGDSMCPGCNVVLVSLDTVRADHLGAYGYMRPTSPAFDRLAERSLLFEDAISQAAWTLPAHGSMMSGLYPDELGVTHYPALRRLPDMNPTLAERFSSAGYATAGFVGGGFVSKHFGFDRGFDSYVSDGRRFEHNIDEAFDWLESVKKRRFFLFFHGYDAHRPYYSDQVDREALGLDIDMPHNRRGYCLGENRQYPADLARVVDHYDASVRHGDRFLGYLLEELARLGLSEKTVVLVTADHGEEFFEHGNCDHVRFVYDETVRVPYLIHVPGRQAARVPGTVPASVSVARTLLDLVGIGKEMPGVSLAPTVAGQVQSFERIFSQADSRQGHFGSRGGTLAMYAGPLKLISYTDEDTLEAYDRGVDPAEQSSLPVEHPVYGRAGELLAWSNALIELPRPAPRPGDERAQKKQKREKLAEELRSLGYVE
ncbi:MAG: sulfatase [Deltaproteobacteria bacterium]|jgi:arylsulfatase A-like enzyme